LVDFIAHLTRISATFYGPGAHDGVVENVIFEILIFVVFGATFVVWNHWNDHFLQRRRKQPASFGRTPSGHIRKRLQNVPVERNLKFQVTFNSYYCTLTADIVKKPRTLFARARNRIRDEKTTKVLGGVVERNTQSIIDK
jgi:hypothetical protein